MAKKRGRIAPQDEPRVIDVTDISQLSTVHFTAEIENLDGSILRIPMRSLGYEEFWAQGDKVPDPVPPATANAKGLQFNYNDPGYLKAVVDTNHKRDYYRLLPCLRIDIQGETEAEKVAHLQRILDYGIAIQLMAMVTRAMSEREARLDAQAANFPLSRAGNGTHPEPPGMEPDHLAQSE